jgi:hypothetical protein
MSSSARLPLSPALLDWLRADPAWRALPWATRAEYRWRAHWGGVNVRLGEARARQQPRPPLAAPLFVLGPWRSGTTVLHELIVAATGRPAPMTWQCMDPTAFHLRGSPPAGPVALARPMDGLPVTATSPQEDEFALLGLGAPSAYRAFLMPHRLGELQNTLDPQYWLDEPTWLSLLEGFLQGVLRTASARDRPLVLKSPNHSYRMRALLRRFPDAQAVWLVRDPILVLHSNRKMWQAMFVAYALTAAPPGALDAFLHLALERAAQALDECTATLPPERLVVVRHEDLSAAPASVVRTVLGRLGLSEALDEPALARAIERCSGGRIDRYPKLPPAPAAPALAALARSHEAALISHGVRADQAPPAGR